MIDQLNAVAAVARAQSEAARANNRFFLFAPRLHLRIIMLRHAMELFAVLVTLFAAPAQSAKPPPGDQPITTPVLPIQPAPRARRPSRPATLSTAAQIRAYGRPAATPQRAGAAPNPNLVSRARHTAPHRLLTPTR